MRRRSATSSRRAMRLMSCAVEQDLAGGRPLEPQDAAAGRGLAAAALAHQAQRLAARDREVDAVDRLHVADLARQHDAFGDREVHVRGRAPRAAAGRRRRPFMPRRPATAPSSALRKQADEMARLARRLERRPRGGAVLDGEAAARPEGAAAVEPRQVGRLAVDRIEPRAARLVEPRHRAQQRHRVGMARVVIDRVGRGPLSTMRPAYMTLTRLA